MRGRPVAQHVVQNVGRPGDQKHCADSGQKNIGRPTDSVAYRQRLRDDHEQSVQRRRMAADTEEIRRQLRDRDAQQLFGTTRSLLFIYSFVF